MVTHTLALHILYGYSIFHTVMGAQFQFNKQTLVLVDQVPLKEQIILDHLISSHPTLWEGLQARKSEAATAERSTAQEARIVTCH